MNYMKGLIPTLLLMITFSIGCSHSAMLTEPVSDNASDFKTPVNHELLGFYTFICDPAANTIDIVSLREVSLHLNALKFLEPPVNVYLTLEGPPEFNGNILDIDIGLRNPYLAMFQFTGFDVCGILFTHGSFSGFNDPELIMAGEGDTRLLNPDGFSRWWNPAEFPHGDTIFSYKDGLLGKPAEDADFNCTINGYKYFADGLDANEPLSALDTEKRGMFTAGQKNVRHYTIDISGGLIFNYAVDACWAPPAGSPPFDVPDDFPEKANRPEAYNIVVTNLGNDLFHDETTGISGGNLKLLLDVRDHFDASLNTVSGESLAGLPCIEADQLGGGDGYCIYEIEFSGAGLTQNGEAELLITVQSEASDYGGVLPGKSLCSYFVYTFDINPEGPMGWARTWGSDFSSPPGSYPNYFTKPDEKASNVVTNDTGNIYITGCFGGSVDFDTCSGDDYHTSNGYTDAYLVLYDSSGQFQWALTWGGAYYDRGRTITIDGMGNIYVIGIFMGTVDFDPGPGEVKLESHGSSYHSAFLSRFGPSGQHHWTKIWGGTNATIPGGLAIDNFGNIYIVGEYLGTVDFDPGPGVDNHPGEKNWLNAFLLKLDFNGDYLLARTWGAYGRQTATSVDFDSANDVYVSGNFSHTVDFDPGPDTEKHSAHDGFQDAFISKFDSNGNFQWVRTWGDNKGYDHASQVAVSDSDDVYITGRFVGTVDFNPGPEIEEYTSVSVSADCFLSKFDISGNWIWTRVWGGTGLDVSYNAIVDGSDFIYTTGSYMDTVDFDPGPGLAEYTSNGARDAFVSKFNLNGDFIWARAWGGENGDTNGDRGLDVALDPKGNVFITGMFEETADFHPGDGVDNHTSNGGTDSFIVRFPPGGNW